MPEERLTLEGSFVDIEDDEWIVFDAETLGAVVRISERYANAEAICRKVSAIPDLIAALGNLMDAVVDRQVAAGGPPDAGMLAALSAGAEAMVKAGQRPRRKGR